MRFAIIHHTRCPGAPFHYRIDADGSVARLRDEAEPGRMRASIAIALEGDFDAETPSPAQLESLKALLAALVRRWPSIAVGAHRHVRGARTRCPGRRFPLDDLRRWWREELPRLRQDEIEDEIGRQYGG